ncbi:phage major capsid protein [Poseidonocella sp. HB161398]|uniref:phage major capsid protein n=1 Tax=Poseidonocella sp. HB161398 TaxID=2320855 RepID=UPI0011084229|nr:phage major capsid protein [Poseidonocella sp. HB161398]
MTNPETKARAGADLPGAQAAPLSAAAEVKTALAGLMQDLTRFQAEMKQQLQANDERLTMLDRKTAFARRPALSAAMEAEAPHQKAFDAYVRSGDEALLRGLELESKSLAVNSDGGYLVDPKTSDMIRSTMASTSSIRSIATVVNVDASSYDVLIDRNNADVTWTTEADEVSETTAPQIERISIPLHELSALPKASQRLLDDSAFDIEGWLAGRIAAKFAMAEAEAFVNGNGGIKPRGFLNHPKVANGTWSWGNLGYIATGTGGDFDSVSPADAIIELVYSLDAEYRANATFVMNSKTAGAVRKMKDADGRFLWSDGLAAGEPARLMGYPVLIAENMPDIGGGAFAIAFGDFSAGYTIAERPDLRILRDPFSAKPHVLFYATKRVGGDVSDFAAIKLLKFGVA